MKKLYLTLIATLFICQAAFAAAPDPSKPPVKIGLLTSLTGSGAIWGEHHLNGARIAIQEINEKGGIDGHRVELVYYDTKGRAEDAVNGIRRLADVEKVIGVAGTSSSGLQLAMLSVSERAKVPLMALSATNPAVTVDAKTGKTHPYSFRMCFTDPYAAESVADFAINDLKKKTAVSFSDVGSDYSEGMTQFFEDQFKKLGGTIKGRFGYRENDVDFRAQVTNAKAAGAEIVFMPGTYKEMALIMKQCHEMDYKPVFIGGDGYSPAMHEIAGTKVTDGSYWANNVAYDDPKLIPLLKKYEKLTGQWPIEPGSTTLSYDSVWVIAEAAMRSAKKTGKISGEGVAKQIYNMKDFKLIDFTYTCDQRNNNPYKKPIAFLICKDGKEHLYKYFTPTAD